MRNRGRQAPRREDLARWLRSARVPLARRQLATTGVAETHRRQRGCQDPGRRGPICSSLRSLWPRGGKGNRERYIVQVDGIEDRIRLRDLTHVAAYRCFITRHIELPHTAQDIVPHIVRKIPAGTGATCHK